MNSMTAFSSAESSSGEETISVEIKSYNSRFLDATFFLPTAISAFEGEFRSRLEKSLGRGKVEVSVFYKSAGQSHNLQLDEDLAAFYFDSQKRLAKKFSLDFSPDITWILSRENVISLQKSEDSRAVFEKVFPVFERAIDGILAERRREGKNLQAAIEGHLAILEHCLDEFKSAETRMKPQFEESIRGKIHEICADFSLDEGRLLQEIALLLVKYTINEEIVRLESHISAARLALCDSLPGKRLDFLCQEMNREVNTIGSKNQDGQISKFVVEAKNAIENIREQAKNAE